MNFSSDKKTKKATAISKSSIVIKKAVAPKPSATDDAVKVLNGMKDMIKKFFGSTESLKQMIGETDNSVYNQAATITAVKKLTQESTAAVFLVAATHCTKGSGCWKKMQKFGKQNNLLYKVWFAIKDTHIRPQSIAITFPYAVNQIALAAGYGVVWEKFITGFIPGAWNRYEMSAEEYGNAMVAHGRTVRKIALEDKSKTAKAVDAEVLKYVKFTFDGEDATMELWDDHISYLASLAKALGMKSTDGSLVALSKKTAKDADKWFDKNNTQLNQMVDLSLGDEEDSEEESEDDSKKEKKKEKPKKEKTEKEEKKKEKKEGKTKKEEDEEDEEEEEEEAAE
jgi:hypothetical protein